MSVKEKNNYYEEIYNKSKNLISNNKIEDALKILKEELSMPYIPKEFEHKYNDLYNEANIKFLSTNVSRKKTISIETIVNSFLKYDGKDFSAIEILLNYLSEINIRKNLEEIISIFSMNHIDNWIKSDLFDLLVEQKIDKDISINKIVLNPSNSKTLEETKELGNVTFKLQKSLEDIQVRETAIGLFEFYLKSIFPRKIEESNYAYYAAIFNLFAIKLLNKKISESDRKNLIKFWNLEETKFEKVMSSVENFHSM